MTSLKPLNCLAHSRGGGSDLRPDFGALLGDRAGDLGTLHFTLLVDNHARVVFEVDEHTLAAAPRLNYA